MAGKKTIWDLALSISGKDDGATAALKQVRKQIQDVQAAAKQLGQDWKAFSQNAGKLALGVVGGVTAAGAATMKLAGDFADAGDKVLQAAKVTGIGVEAYQELQYAMRQSGVSVETFDAALDKFNLTVKQGAAGNAAAQKQLEAIGLSASKLAGMKPEEAMMRLSDYMKSLPDDVARLRASVSLFGKSAGPEMAAALGVGSEAINKLREESKSATFTFSKDQAELSRQFKNTQANLADSFDNVKFSFIAGAMEPAIEALKVFTGTVNEGVPAIQELGAKFGEWLKMAVQKLPQIIQGIKDFGAWVKDTATGVANFVGGWKNLAKILAGLAVAPTLISGLKVVWSFGKLVNTAIGAWPNILAKIAPAFASISTAALPIIGIIAGIALVIYTVVRNFDTLKTYALDCIERIKSAFSGGTGGMATDWKQVGETVKTVLGVIMSLLEGGVLLAIKTVMNALTSGIQIVIGVFKVLWGVVQAGFAILDAVAKVAIALFRGDFSGAVKAIGELFVTLGNIGQGMFDGLRAMLGGFIDFFINNFKDGFDFAKGIIDGLADKFGGMFTTVKEKVEAFVDFFKSKMGAVKDFFGGIGDKIGGLFGKGNAGGMPAHAAGGIFTHRHIAEIAEHGAEAVVPLNKSSQGFDVWKQAGLIGGYLQRAAQTQTATAGASTPETSPVMAAAAQKISSSDNSIRVDIHQNFTFTGGPQDKETVRQIAEAGRKSADDFEAKLEEYQRRKKRLSYA